MELFEALQTRRAIREFTDAEVDEGVIDDLIGLATLAPSAMNLQPWAFAVVRGKARLMELASQAKSHAQAHVPAGSPLASHLADPRFEIFHGAPALVVVCATDASEQSAEDCCLAAATFMLAAHGKGLGTCWIGLSRPWLDEPSVKAELGIPPELRPVAPLILGHPRARPKPTARKAARIVRCR